MNIAIGLSVLVLARHPKPPPPPASAVIDVSSYTIDLSLDNGTGTFTTKTTLKLTSKNASDVVVLDSSGLEITSATVGEGGAAAQASLAKQPSGDDLLTLKLPVPLAGGAETTLVVQAKGKALEGGDLGLIKHVDPDDPSRVIYYTMFEPTGARRLFPCHDVPDDKATFELPSPPTPTRRCSPTERRSPTSRSRAMAPSATG
jgi:alanyl aminopeptidase